VQVTSDISLSGASCTTAVTPSQLVQSSSENDSLDGSPGVYPINSLGRVVDEPKQYQSSTKAVPKQHQSSTKAAPKQYQNSTKEAPKKHQRSTKEAPKAVPKQYLIGITSELGN